MSLVGGPPNRAAPTVADQAADVATPVAIAPVSELSAPPKQEIFVQDDLEFSVPAAQLMTSNDSLTLMLPYAPDDEELLLK